MLELRFRQWTLESGVLHQWQHFSQISNILKTSAALKWMSNLTLQSFLWSYVTAQPTALIHLLTFSESISELMMQMIPFSFPSCTTSSNWSLSVWTAGWRSDPRSGPVAPPWQSNQQPPHTSVWRPTGAKHVLHQWVDTFNTEMTPAFDQNTLWPQHSGVFLQSSVILRFGPLF